MVDHIRRQRGQRSHLSDQPAAVATYSIMDCSFGEGEAPAEPHASTMSRLGRSLALPKRRTSIFRRAESTRPARGGFTLLEVLIASGLCVVLMSAIYSALDLYWRYATAGREEMERSQIARAILRKIEIDIRSVVFREEEPATDDEGRPTVEGEETTEEDEELLAEVVDPEDAYNSGGIGVVGDANVLVLHISQPPKNLLYGAIADGGASFGPLSDLTSVSYFLASPGAEGLSGTVGDMLAGNSGDDGSQGLARLAGDRFTMNLADEQGNTDLLLAGTQLVAAEVNYLGFRYFDGVEWLDVWDSAVNGRLPQAIEITLGLRPPDKKLTAALGSAISADKTYLYRLVVALPMAEPYIEEF